MKDKIKRHLNLKIRNFHSFLYVVLAFMLNFKIYFWHEYKIINENKDLIEIFIIYCLHNIKAITTVILEILKT